MGDEAPYILGTGDDELARLGLQHLVWSAEAFALWERAGIRPGDTVLDVGCGPGWTTLDLAHVVGPEGRVIAVDESTRFVEHLRAQAAERGLLNVDARVGDVTELELEPGSVDVAYSRWVLCFVSDPEEVVRRVAHALRSGGVFCVQDYFNQRTETVAPRDPVLDRVFEAIGDSWRTRGGDPDIAGRLPRIFRGVGLETVEILPHLKLGPPGSPAWEWIEGIVLPYLSTLVELKLVTPEERASFESEWARRREDTASFFLSPPVLDVIGKKP